MRQGSETYDGRAAGVLPNRATASEEGHHEGDAADDNDDDGDRLRVDCSIEGGEVSHRGQHNGADHDQQDATGHEDQVEQVQQVLEHGG